MTPEGYPFGQSAGVTFNLTCPAASVEDIDVEFSCGFDGDEAFTYVRQGAVAGYVDGTLEDASCVVSQEMVMDDGLYVTLFMGWNDSENLPDVYNYTEVRGVEETQAVLVPLE